MKYLFFCIFFSCMAMQDPLSQFGIDMLNEVSINYNNNETVAVKDIHIKSNAIYVFFTTNDSRGIVRQYDMAGNVVKEVEINIGADPVTFENAIQILWEDDYFYLPGVYVDLDGGHGAIQKYNYEIELQLDFGNNGTKLFKDIDFNCAFSSITSLGNKYLAGGCNQNQVPGNVLSSYIILDFDSEDGSINHYYQEDVRPAGATRSMRFMQLYYHNLKYYVVGVTFENELIYQELNQANDLLFQKANGIRIDYMAPINTAMTQFYGVDNGGHNLYMITVTPGEGDFVSVDKVADIPSVRQDVYPWISSLAIKSKRLFLAGGYDIGVLNFTFSTPLVLAYKITDPSNPILDTASFQEGRWGLQAVFLGDSYKTAMFFVRNNPYSFLLGYGGTLFHIASLKGFSDTLDNIKKTYMLPFIS